MKTLTQYGLMAERHWREFLPRMVGELQRKGLLRRMLREAEEKTAREVDDLQRHFQEQGLTPQQAQGRAWEIVRERYIFLPPESPQTTT